MARLLDPQGQHIAQVLARDHCIDRDQVYLKDMRLILGRSPADIILVDNSILSFSQQFDNAIYAPSFTGCRTDRELETLEAFLLKIALVEDVRPFVRQFAGLVNLHEQFLKQQILRFDVIPRLSSIDGE